MFSYKYTEDTARKFFFENAREMGKFYAEAMFKTPELYKQFMEGFYEGCLREHAEGGRGPDKKSGDSGGS